MIWKNPDRCDTVRKMGNDLDKIWAGMKLSEKWEMIRKNPDLFETVRKMGNDMEKSGQF